MKILLLVFLHNRQNTIYHTKTLAAKFFLIKRKVINSILAAGFLFIF